MLVGWKAAHTGSAFAGTSMLIEDVACPVNKLADMTVDLVDMFQKYGYKDASCFGHALEGNLHLVFSQVSTPAALCWGPPPPVEAAAVAGSFR